MLIYAAADIHGDAQRIRRIEQQVAAHQPDLLVLVGDISRRWQPQRMLCALDRLVMPVLLIRGNGDSRQLTRLLSSHPCLRSVHLSQSRINGVDFVGVGGTLPLPFHSRLGLGETESVTRLSGMLQTHIVLLVDPPPYGVRDRVLDLFHAGSRAVGRLVDRCSPALVICVHIHEQYGFL